MGLISRCLAGYEETRLDPGSGESSAGGRPVTGKGGCDAEDVLSGCRDHDGGAAPGRSRGTQGGASADRERGGGPGRSTFDAREGARGGQEPGEPAHEGAPCGGSAGVHVPPASAHRSSDLHSGGGQGGDRRGGMQGCSDECREVPGAHRRDAGWQGHARCRDLGFVRGGAGAERAEREAGRL